MSPLKNHMLSNYPEITLNDFSYLKIKIKIKIKHLISKSSFYMKILSRKGIRQILMGIVKDYMLKLTLES